MILRQVSGCLRTLELYREGHAHEVSQVTPSMNSGANALELYREGHADEVIFLSKIQKTQARTCWLGFFICFQDKN